MTTLTQHQSGHLLTEMLAMHDVLPTDNLDQPSKGLEVYRLAALYVSESQWRHEVYTRALDKMFLNPNERKWVREEVFMSFLANKTFFAYNKYTQYLIWSFIRRANRRANKCGARYDPDTVRLIENKPLGQWIKVVDRRCLFLIALAPEPEDRVQSLIDLLQEIESGLKGPGKYIHRGDPLRPTQY